MKKVISIHILLLLFIFMHSYAFSEQTFGPWNAKVKVGDSGITYYPQKKIIVLKAIQKKQKLHKARANNNKSKWGGGIFNGLQGGAFFLIRFFQVVISPQDGPNCRYHPTCSAYGREAVSRHGALVGAFLAGDRIIRCNPYNPPGADPVPREDGE